GVEVAQQEGNRGGDHVRAEKATQPPSQAGRRDRRVLLGEEGRRDEESGGGPPGGGGPGRGALRRDDLGAGGGVDDGGGRRRLERVDRGPAHAGGERGRGQRGSVTRRGSAQPAVSSGRGGGVGAAISSASVTRPPA